VEKLVATAPKTFIRQQVEIPPLYNDQVLIRTKSIGICGSDIHLFHGDHPYTTYPMVFGHEASGIVEKVGGGIQDLNPGDHVVLEPLIPCGICYPCSIGRTNCCSNMKTVGVTTDGALAELFTVPASCLHKLPKELPFDLAALAEPFSIGFHAVQRGNVSADDTVLVIGAGMIGLTILAAAKDRGARVMIADMLDYRLALAEKMGADEIVNSKEFDMTTSVHAWTDGIGPSVVFEAVGLPVTLQSAVDIVCDAGRVVVVGVTKEKFCIRGVDVTKKELAIIGSRNNLGQFSQALAFVINHQESAYNLISDTFPFSESEQAFAHASNNPQNTCKVMITF
jgi:L-gulonate 5-dehydrogenase